MLRNPPIMLLALAVVVVLANVWLVAFTLGGPTAGPPLPNPNGYDDFVKAAGLLTGDASSAYPRRPLELHPAAPLIQPPYRRFQLLRGEERGGKAEKLKVES